MNRSKLILFFWAMVTLRAACDKNAQNTSSRFHKFVNVQVTLDPIKKRFLLLEQRVTNLTAKLKEYKLELDELKRAAITGIQLGQLQQTTIFRGDGYTDTPGFVITGVNNLNANAWPDNVFRREIQVFKNGIWQPVPVI